MDSASSPSSRRLSLRSARSTTYDTIATSASSSSASSSSTHPSALAPLNLADLDAVSTSALPTTPAASRGWTSHSSGLSAQHAAFVFSADGLENIWPPASSSSSSSSSLPPSRVLYLDDENTSNSRTPTSRRRSSWLTLLILPARLAVGALTFFAGARLSSGPSTSSPTSTTSAASLSKPMLYTPWGWLGGIAATAVSQIIISYALTRTRHQQVQDTAVANEIASQQRINWLDAIQAVGKIVDRFADGLGAPETFASVRSIFLDVSLVRLVHLSTLQRHVRTARSRPTSTSDALARGRHYLDFAMASYGYVLLRLTGIVHAEYDVTVEGLQGEDVARYLLGLDEYDDMIVSHLDGEEINIPRHFVALDHTYRTVVVSIRGTNSISDIITDLICSNEEFANGYAHGGMKSSAEILCASLLPSLHELRRKYPRYTLVTTGHSLGAGVAILLTKLLLNQGFSDVKCYAFAPCPVFGPLHKVDSEWSDALECFVHADDMVATLCLASARRLALEIERIDKKVELDFNEKRTIVNGNQASVIERILGESRLRDPDPREEEVDQLFIPCHRGVHWLIPDESEDEDGQREKSNNTDNSIENTTNITDRDAHGLQAMTKYGTPRPRTSSGTIQQRTQQQRQQEKDDNAIRAYNNRWGKRARAEQHKKWKKKVENLNGAVPPAYVPVAKFGSYIVRPRVFEKMLVTPNCVNAHFPNMYTAAFAGLDLPARERPLPPKPKTNYTRSWYSNELG